MKIKIGLLALVLSYAFTRWDCALAQGTAFTYQGQLLTANGPAQGLYDLTFALYNAGTGGTQVGSAVQTNGVLVTNGLFTVMVDFGSGLFNGTTYWLQIGVRTNGAASFAALAGRQQLTPTPYAIYAEGASATGLLGTIPSGDLGGTYGNPVNLNNPGNSFTGNGTGLTNVNAGLLGGLASSNFWQTTGNAGTTPGANFVGTTDNEPLELDAYGVRGLHLERTGRSSGGPLFFTQSGVNVIGGYWGNIISNTVIGGTIAGGGDETGPFIFTPYPNIVNNDFGAIGGGYGNLAGLDSSIPGGYYNIATGDGSFAAGRRAQTANAGSFVWGDGSRTNTSFGANCFDVLATGGVHFLTGTPGVNVDQINLNGAVSDGLVHRSTVAGQSVGPGGSGPFLWGYEGGALGTVLPEEVNLIWDYSGNVWISNNCSVATLTIRGGADLAEPFPISAAQPEMPPGSVVVIDDQHPGQLKLSDQPYDTRVAGVVSGANGVHPGIQMQQQGLLAGGKNVALTGRVYVRADANYGAIHPGDFLTTSATPGCAMKVTDHFRAEGAILGKAMTGLNEGKGMVLVLVTLQ
jgi:hypothetical protein